jgi:hypothetical protein
MFPFASLGIISVLLETTVNPSLIYLDVCCNAIESNLDVCGTAIESN